jgi:hypothetical protein
VSENWIRVQSVKTEKLSKWLRDVICPIAMQMYSKVIIQTDKKNGKVIIHFLKKQRVRKGI